MTSSEYRRLSMLLTNIKNGSRESFASIFSMYGQKVYFLCCKLTGSKTEAKKLTVDFFDFIYLQCASFTNAASFEKWLYNTLFTRCRRFIIENHPEMYGDYIDSNSSDGDEVDILMAEDADAMLAAEDGIDVSVDMMQIMDSILSELPLKLRTAVFLYYFCGFDFEETASAEQISLMAVKNRLLRAHIRLATEEHKYTEIGYNVAGIVTFLPEVLSTMAQSIVMPEDIAAGVTSSTGVNCMNKADGEENDADATRVITAQKPKSANYTTTGYAAPVQAKKSAGQNISPAVKVLMAIVAILIIIGGTVAVVLAVQGHKSGDREDGSVQSVERTDAPATIVVTTREQTTVTTTEPTTETTTQPETTTEAPTTQAPTTQTEPQTTAPETTAAPQIPEEPAADVMPNGEPAGELLDE